MRPLLDMETVQIEVTNHCHNQCANCTRLVGHFENPYFMDYDMFKNAVDSMADFPKMVGVMGGEPLLHPSFEKLCNYIHSKFPPEQLGLWTSFPKGKEHYREVIVETFGNIFLNDHTRDDVLHAPVLVSSNEFCENAPFGQWYLIDKCWVQNTWSASINPKGGFFCEVAAALALLFDINAGWEVKPHWWEKSPIDFVEQMRTLCTLCGCAMPIARRASTEGIDDISPGNYERLKDISPKLKRGKYIIHDLLVRRDNRQIASYKDENYRKRIAARYGMFLMLTQQGYQKPYLKKEWKCDSI
jgi:hypothetical protein